MNFCECNPRRSSVVRTSDGKLAHSGCGKPVECEWTYMDDPKCGLIATGEHCGYFHCAHHESAAINVVSLDL